MKNNNSNETKFWILSKSENNDNHEEKITIIFSTKHKPGALYKVLNVFYKNNLNLTKIESRPTKEKLGEYYFLVDIEIENKNYQKAIDELKEIVEFYRILGKYKKEV